MRDVSILAAATKEKTKENKFHLFSDVEKLYNDFSNRLRDSEGALRNDINNLLK